MQAILGFYHRLTDLYEFQVETEMAIRLWAERLGNMATTGRSTLDNRMFFGKDDPNSPDALYHAVRTYRDLIHDAGEGGRNLRLHRNGVIAIAYSLWEDSSRGAMASECNLSKNAIKSDVFQDLNKYRQAILHVDGKLDRKPKVMKFFKVGEVVSFTQGQMDHLFADLISELNRLGKTYYDQDPGLSLDKSMSRPRQG